MTQVTITKIFDKERTSRAGKPFTSRAIKTNEHGDKWLSGFKGKENADWREGDTVEIEIEANGEYLNYSVPKATFSNKPGAGDLNRVEVKIDRVLSAISTLGGEITGIKSVLSEALRAKDPLADEFDKDVPF